MAQEKATATGPNDTPPPPATAATSYRTNITYQVDAVLGVPNHHPPLPQAGGSTSVALPPPQTDTLLQQGEPSM